MYTPCAMASGRFHLRAGDLLPRIRAVVAESEDYETITAFIRAAIRRLLQEVEGRA